ncbi:MAG: ribonuclease III [Flavobacteriaceae bacterium]|nr:ribonuclease III [Flavobacteriaceae bacterium]
MNFIRKINLPFLRKEDLAFAKKIKKTIGFLPKKIHYYKEAFTHTSLKKIDSSTKNQISYERLEFLGDAILSAVISSYLFEKLPCENEGHLTQMRSKIVSRTRLNELGKELNLVDFIEKDEHAIRLSNHIDGNLLEALIGAIYMDRGYLYSQKFIYKKVLKPYIDIEKLEGKITSYKSFFIEWCQKKKYDYTYEVYEDSGKNSKQHFSVKLFLNGNVVSKGRATSKKKAEEIASKRAYYHFQNQF